MLVLCFAVLLAAIKEDWEDESVSEVFTKLVVQITGVDEAWTQFCAHIVHDANTLSEAFNLVSIQEKESVMLAVFDELGVAADKDHVHQIFGLYADSWVRT